MIKIGYIAKYTNTINSNIHSSIFRTINSNIHNSIFRMILKHNDGRYLTIHDLSSLTTNNYNL